MLTNKSKETQCLFNPLIKLKKDVINSVPQEIRVTQFFDKGLFQSLMNAHNDEGVKTLKEATQKGYVNNNITLTINTIFESHNIFTFMDEKYTIADTQWTNGNWKLDSKYEKKTINLDGVTDPLLFNTLVDKKIEEANKEIEYLEKKDPSVAFGDNYVNDYPNNFDNTKFNPKENNDENNDQNNDQNNYQDNKSKLQITDGNEPSNINNKRITQNDTNTNNIKQIENNVNNNTNKNDNINTNNDERNAKVIQPLPLNVPDIPYSRNTTEFRNLCMNYYTVLDKLYDNIEAVNVKAINKHININISTNVNLNNRKLSRSNYNSLVNNNKLIKITNTSESLIESIKLIVNYHNANDINNRITSDKYSEYGMEKEFTNEILTRMIDTSKNDKENIGLIETELKRINFIIIKKTEKNNDEPNANITFPRKNNVLDIYYPDDITSINRGLQCFIYYNGNTYEPILFDFKANARRTRKRGNKNIAQQKTNESRFTFFNISDKKIPPLNIITCMFINKFIYLENRVKDSIKTNIVKNKYDTTFGNITLLNNSLNNILSNSNDITNVLMFYNNLIKITNLKENVFNDKYLIDFNDFDNKYSGYINNPPLPNDDEEINNSPLPNDDENDDNNNSDTRPEQQQEEVKGESSQPPIARNAPTNLGKPYNLRSRTSQSGGEETNTINVTPLITIPTKTTNDQRILNLDRSSGISYHIVLDMELIKGTTLTDEDKSKLVCRRRWNTIRKAYSEFMGKKYIIPPVYDDTPSKYIKKGTKKANKNKKEKEKEKEKENNKSKKKRNKNKKDKKK